MVRFTLLTLLVAAASVTAVSSIETMTTAQYHLRALQPDAATEAPAEEGPGGGDEGPGGGDEGPGGAEGEEGGEPGAEPTEPEGGGEEGEGPGDAAGGNNTTVPETEEGPPADQVANTTAPPGVEAESGPAPADNTTSTASPVPIEGETLPPADVNGTIFDVNATMIPVTMGNETEGNVTTSEEIGGDNSTVPEVLGNATEVPGNATEVPGNATEVPGNTTGTNETEVGTGVDINTIVEVVSGEPDLTGLTGAVTASGIANALDPLENYTIFAPTDEAFAAVAAAAPELFTKLTTEPSWNAHLSNLLAFHVVAGAVRSTDLTDAMVVTMLNGENITVTVNDEGVSITSAVTTNASIVTTADLEADNGVVHKVSGVLLPDFVGRDLVGLANTTAGANFQTLFSLINAINLGPLIDTAGDVTVFAPTDEAFAALGDDVLATLQEDRVELTRILSNHVLQGIVASSAVSDGMDVKPLGENQMYFSIQNDTLTVNGATVTIADVLANNGIVHAIDMVLLEPFTPDGGANTTNTTDVPAPAPGGDEPDPAPASAPAPTAADADEPAPTPADVPDLPTAPTASSDRSGAMSVSFMGGAAAAGIAALLAMV